ncbi:unnamed protein product [Owenia fusiformis]|uniref:Uncharacterized protein n=1 Tax=Owenia fusiformis TaxID=6347 RepID=A0A8J1TM88_OWEFU|nr:unnamed protein product [Owenia fusiformis]
MQKIIQLSCIVLLCSIGSCFAVSCTHTANCTVNTGEVCNVQGACTTGTCECPTGEVVFNSSCITPVAHAGACLTSGGSTNCKTTGATCTNGTCQCTGAGQAYFSVSDACALSTYESQATLGGACNATKICTGTYQTCTNNTCVCSQREVNGVCKYNKVIGSACTLDADCSATAFLSVCVNSTCQCQTNYTAQKVYGFNALFPTATIQNDLGGLDMCVYTGSTSKNSGESCQVSGDGTTTLDVCSSSAPYCVMCGDQSISTNKLLGKCSTASSVSDTVGGNDGGSGGSGAEIKTASMLVAALTALMSVVMV